MRGLVPTNAEAVSRRPKLSSLGTTSARPSQCLPPVDPPAIKVNVPACGEAFAWHCQHGGRWGVGQMGLGAGASPVAGEGAAVGSHWRALEANRGLWVGRGARGLGWRAARAKCICRMPCPFGRGKSTGRTTRPGLPTCGPARLGWPPLSGQGWVALGPPARGVGGWRRVRLEGVRGEGWAQQFGQRACNAVGWQGWQGWAGALCGVWVGGAGVQHRCTPAGAWASARQLACARAWAGAWAPAKTARGTCHQAKPLAFAMALATKHLPHHLPCRRRLARTHAMGAQTHAMGAQAHAMGHMTCSLATRRGVAQHAPTSGGRTPRG